jgi:hypothetical protein
MGPQIMDDGTRVRACTGGGHPRDERFPPIGAVDRGDIRERQRCSQPFFHCLFTSPLDYCYWGSRIAKFPDLTATATACWKPGWVQWS